MSEALRISIEDEKFEARDIATEVARIMNEENKYFVVAFSRVLKDRGIKMTDDLRNEVIEILKTELKPKNLFIVTKPKNIRVVPDEKKKGFAPDKLKNMQRQARLQQKGEEERAGQTYEQSGLE